MHALSNSLLSFCHFNVRSLCSSFDEFSDYVVTEQLDIVGLSETWLNKGISTSALEIEGYKLIRKDRDQRGGGVGFYINNAYKFRVLDVSSFGDNIEQIWVSVKLGGKNVCVGSIYRPPNENIINCLGVLENTIISMLPNYDAVIFGSDFNVDCLSKQSGSLSLNNFLDKYGMHQIIMEPTRITNNSKTLLDIIVTSSLEYVRDPEVVRMDGVSDHCLVKCNIYCKRLQKTIKFRTCRDYSSFNYNAFLADMYGFNWDFLYTLGDVNEMVNFFTGAVNDLFDRHAPYKTSRITKSPAPWITPNIKYLMRLRNKAHSKYKKVKTAESWNEYKQLRNFVTMSVRNEKKAYLNHQFRVDPKGFWRTLKWLNINSVPDSNPGDVGTPNDFNRYFLNNIPPINNQHNDNIYNYESSKFHNTNTFRFLEVGSERVETIISELRSDAKGSDGLDRRNISLIVPHLIHHITFIINSCISAGKFPSQWKIANVLPIPKNNTPSELSHFRPISLLPVFSKILEKVVYEQLNNYFLQHQIIPSTQSGFRSQHSTTTALLKVTDDVMRSVDDGKCTCLLLLDYSKAFDTLDHTMLCTKLKYYGLDDLALGFLKDYLQERHQRVILGSNTSEILSLNRGVPQGSILGPLLFSLYTADFGSYLKYLQSHQYADDFQLYYSFNTDHVEEVEAHINQDLNIIYNISLAHNLLLNQSKTQLLLFGKNYSYLSDNLNIQINNIKIKASESCKNLGVHIDSKLRFRGHISYLLQTSYGKLRTLYLFKHFLTSEIKLRLCDSLILSLLSYCDVLYWPALLLEDRESLQRLQNGCLRFCYGLRKFDHVTQCYTDSGWLKLDLRFYLHICTLVFKIMKFKQPTYLLEKLVRGSDIHDRHTRHNYLFSVPRHKTALFQRSFNYNAVKYFNSLSDNIKNCSTIETFKKNLKAHLKAIA